MPHAWRRRPLASVLAARRLVRVHRPPSGDDVPACYRLSAVVGVRVLAGVRPCGGSAWRPSSWVLGGPFAVCAYWSGSWLCQGSSAQGAFGVVGSSRQL